MHEKDVWEVIVDDYFTVSCVCRTERCIVFDCRLRFLYDENRPRRVLCVKTTEQ